MSKLFKTSIKDNKHLKKNYYLITLHPLGKIAKPKPGQFFMVSAGSSHDPLLRRPFSLHRWLGQDFQLLYRVAGKATGILKDKKAGEILDIIGPLGNGFPALGQKTKIILLAGGLGIAPIFALTETIVKKKPLFFLGAKTKKELLCMNELKSIGIKPVVSTDDGTSGKKGFITNEFRKFLTYNASRIMNYCLYACGPKPMLKELSCLTKKYDLKGYIALEEVMACGIGACLSCVANTKEGVKRVCKEGPVFSIDEIVW